MCQDAAAKNVRVTTSYRGGHAKVCGQQILIMHSELYWLSLFFNFLVFFSPGVSLSSNDAWPMVGDIALDYGRLKFLWY